MAGIIPEHVIQQIARGVDIVRLVGRYCEVHKRGSRFWALCPFHKEKTPSFSIDAENGLYYCFGCKEGGNVFTFVQKMEGLSFREALQSLAPEAGVDLSQYRSEEGPSRSQIAQLREINELATSFYQKCLRKSQGGQKARDYLAGRGISDASLEAWRIGYAPEGWDSFLKVALKRGHSAEMVAAAGLAVERQEAPGYYDRFRNRIMFPIADTAGRTIGFGARALEPGDEPKYLNSPETALFSKGRCFFGLAQAREAIRATKTAVVLEGYTDVIMAHQHGVTESVAVLGTSLTADHARQLSRLCRRVIIVFDADESGQQSADRSIEVLLNEEPEVRVASLPAGQDPCDFVLANGGEAFRKVLEASKGFFEFRLEVARHRHDMATAEGRAAAFREVAELAVLVNDPVRRDVIVRQAAQALGISETNAWAYVERQSRRAAPQRKQAAEDGTRLSAEETLPGELLGLLLAHPEHIPEAARRLDLTLLKSCPQTELIGKLLKASAEGDPDVVRRFLQSLTQPDLAAVACGALAEEQSRRDGSTPQAARSRLEGYIAYLQDKKLRETVASLGTDGEAIRQRIRLLKQRDRKSAQPK